MIRGLYTAASGMLASMRRMEFVTNNLANSQTTGFKQDRSALSTFDEMMILQDAAQSAGRAGGPAPELGELGMAAVAEEPMIDFTQGSFQETGRVLDVALEGPGFFTVQSPDGIRYTRDGGFTRDSTGRLVTTEGDAVLDVDGNEIVIPPGTLVIHPDGVMTVENQELATLGLVEFALDQPLRKIGNNQFVARDEGDEPVAATGTAIRQGAIEASNVDMAGAQTSMMELQRAYQAAQRLIQYQDEMVGRAVNDIARPV